MSEEKDYLTFVMEGNPEGEPRVQLLSQEDMQEAVANEKVDLLYIAKECIRMVDYLLSEPHVNEDAVPCDTPVSYNRLIRDNLGIWLPLNAEDTSARILLRGSITHPDGTTEIGLYGYAVNAKHHLGLIIRKNQLKGVDLSNFYLETGLDEDFTLDRSVVSDLLDAYRMLTLIVEEDANTIFTPNMLGVHYIY